MSQYPSNPMAIARDMDPVRLFHGITPNGSIISELDHIALNGFSRSSRIYFARDPARALAYRRDLDFDEFASDAQYRGLVEITSAGLQLLPDNTVVLDDPKHPSFQDGYSNEWVEYFDRYFPAIDDELRRKWALLVQCRDESINDESVDITSLPGYQEAFGDANIFDAAQQIADEANIAATDDISSSLSNVSVNGPIDASSIIGCYIFDVSERHDSAMPGQGCYSFKCVRADGNDPSLQIGQVIRATARDELG